MPVKTTGVPADNNGMSETQCLAFAVLRDVAEELSLETVLLELRDFYREARDDEFTRTNADYAHICDTSLRALDAALWRLETDSISESQP